MLFHRSDGVCSFSLFIFVPFLLIFDSAYFIILFFLYELCLTVFGFVVKGHKMGRKTGTLYINSKKFGSLHKPCMKEMVTFLNCLALNHNNDDKCVRTKDLLSACMNAQVDF